MFVYAEFYWLIVLSVNTLHMFTVTNLRTWKAIFKGLEAFKLE